ncbi:hypothetical protein BVY02_00335 [bacterium J17]|nr:hypothetical protein BVY02_00335 [bacterium J17]
MQVNATRASKLKLFGDVSGRLVVNASGVSDVSIYGRIKGEKKIENRTGLAKVSYYDQRKPSGVKGQGS